MRWEVSNDSLALAPAWSVGQSHGDDEPCRHTLRRHRSVRAANRGAVSVGTFPGMLWTPPAGAPRRPVTLVDEQRAHEKPRRRGGRFVCSPSSMVVTVDSSSLDSPLPTEGHHASSERAVGARTIELQSGGLTNPSHAADTPSCKPPPPVRSAERPVRNSKPWRARP